MGVCPWARGAHGTGRREHAFSRQWLWKLYKVVKVEATSMLTTATATASKLAVAVVTERDLDMAVGAGAVMRAKCKGLQHT